MFTPCGKVIKIDIRCCSGTAVPGANANTVYATVLFVSVNGATQALFKHGVILLGKRIVVCSRAKYKDLLLLIVVSFILQVAPSFLALPEARQGIRRRPISVFGVNLTKIRFVQGYDEFLGLTNMKISDTIQYTANRICSGGTQIFPTKEEE